MRWSVYWQFGTLWNKINKEISFGETTNPYMNAFDFVFSSRPIISSTYSPLLAPSGVTVCIFFTGRSWQLSEESPAFLLSMIIFSEGKNINVVHIVAAGSSLLHPKVTNLIKLCTYPTTSDFYVIAFIWSLGGTVICQLSLVYVRHGIETFRLSDCTLNDMYFITNSEKSSNWLKFIIRHINFSRNRLTIGLLQIGRSITDKPINVDKYVQ